MANRCRKEGRWWAAAAALAVVAAGCLSSAPGPPAAPGGVPNSPPTTGATKMQPIEITSSAFANDERIPKKYTGEGQDVSPALTWSGAPEGTQELALICDDPDAPRPEPWVHWVIYGLPPNIAGLPEGVPRELKLKDPPGSLQGKNSWPEGENVGYRGPMPPPRHGLHHYHFVIYALGGKTNLPPGATKEELLAAMKGKILATGKLTGTYSR